MPPLTITTQAQVLAVLADPRFEVPPIPAVPEAPAVPAPAAAPEPDPTVVGIDWLRWHVARFCSGAAHARRRALATVELDRLPPAALRRRAGELTAAILATAGLAATARAARTVPVTVLAEALGRTDPAQVCASVAVVARGYHPGTAAGPAGDRAVSLLVNAFGGTPDEVTAARIGLLVQAHDATATLITNALAYFGGGPTVDAVIAESLRYDPPARLIRRVAVRPARIGDLDVAQGTVVHLDLAAANRDPAAFTDPDRFDPARPDTLVQLPFGSGLRPCPGSAQAIALAAGVLEALGLPRGEDLVEGGGDGAGLVRGQVAGEVALDAGQVGRRGGA